MAIELRQQLKLTQQLIMTPQLQMAIKLLQLSRLELMDMIREELEQNPALEEVQEVAADEPSEEPYDQQPENAQDVKEVDIQEKIDPDMDWSGFMEEYNSPGRVHMEKEEKEAPKYEAFVAQRESLGERLLWQLMLTSPDDAVKEIGSVIIGNINKDGYLEATVEEISIACQAPVEQVEAALSLLQTFDPAGVCARNLQECLLVQARRLGVDSPVITGIVEKHLTHLENRNINAICRAMKISLNEAAAAINVIRGLEPRPGRQFGGEEPQYITPDIFVYKFEDEFVIVLNDDGMPRLRINNYYQNAINRDGKLTRSAKDYMQDKLRSAAWLIKSIHQRQKTIYKVMESILKFQREFFENGIEYLRPMVLKDVAEDIEMHESTISRVTSNKYVYIPQGVFELKYFFNSPINRLHGDAVASVSVQEKIRCIIENEDPKKPFSDDGISQMLKEYNIDIARRTVAKYREMMGILSSNKRKQY